MQTFSTQQGRSYITIVLSGIALLFAWISIDATIREPLLHGWTMPILWLSLGISVLCLVPFLTAKKGVFALGAGIAFLPALFLMFHEMALFALLGATLCFLAFVHIRRTIDERLRVHVRKSLYGSVGLIVLGFSLTISALYYASVRHETGDALLQRLSLDRASRIVLTQTLEMINSDFKHARQTNITVDEFLITMQKSQLKSMTIDALPSDTELLRLAGMTAQDPRAAQVLAQIKKEWQAAANMTQIKKDLVLAQSRLQLADVAGMSLTGNENVTDVFSHIVDQRVRTLLEPNTVNNAGTMLPFILTMIVFLTLWSMGALLGILWRFLTAIEFTLMRYVGIVEVQTTMIEKETIV